MDLKNIINKFIKKITTKKPKIMALDEYINVLAGFERQDKTDTLILGSSHFRYGYLAEGSEYNLATASQDLYYSYNFYEKFNNDNIKTVILGYAYFSPYHVIIKTKFADVCIVPKILMDIDYQYPQDAEEKGLYELEEKYRELINNEYNKKLKKLPKNYKGIINYYRNKYRKPSDDEIKATLNTFKREHVQIQYLIKFLEKTKMCNQKFYIVLPPHTKDFRTNCHDEYFKNFDELTNILKDYDHVKLLNFYEDNDFSDDDFDDMVHLSLKGAKKLTAKIHSNL